MDIYKSIINYKSKVAIVGLGYVGLRSNLRRRKGGSGEVSINYLLIYYSLV